MRNIGPDCWNMINEFKMDLELLDHRKKFAASLKTIRDSASYCPGNRISSKMLDLYLLTWNVVSCDNSICPNVHTYRLMDSFSLNEEDVEIMYNEEYQHIDRIMRYTEEEEDEIDILGEYLEYIDYE